MVIGLRFALLSLPLHIANEPRESMATIAPPQKWLYQFVILASLAIVLAMASWAQAVLIPIALAVLLTFLLTPVLNLLEHYGAGRVPAVVIVVVLVGTLLTSLGWLIGYQVANLVDTFPEYEQNLNQKVASFREAGQGGFIDKLESVFRSVSRQVEYKDNPPPDVLEAKPQLVRLVTEDEPLGLSRLWSVLGPFMDPVGSIGLAAVLVVFMLLKREDLRDRMISVIGHGRLTVTTKALDEAGQRISRYLLMQLIINGSFGACIALGLVVIGVPYAALWGFLAGTLRYIPYLGPWLAALLPLALSLLVMDGLSGPIMILGLFLVLELISNLIMEPWLYGKGIGVSEAATLVMVSFWTWLWGPIGLVLATPLTVVLVVLGRHVPFLKFFATLLGDQPALEMHVGYYQRLLARDQDEALDIAEEHLRAHTLVETYDELLSPALANARRDLDGDRLDEADQAYVVRATREIAEELETLNAHKLSLKQVPGQENPATHEKLPLVLCCPARDETDEAAIVMLRETLDPKRCQVAVVGTDLLASEVVEAALEKRPAVFCILAIPTGGLAQARLLCLRLRARMPDLKIVVGRWALKGNSATSRAQLEEAGADAIGTTIAETHSQVMSFVQLAPQKEEAREMAGAGK